MGLFWHPLKVCLGQNWLWSLIDDFATKHVQGIILSETLMLDFLKLLFIWFFKIELIVDYFVIRLFFVAFYAFNDI